GLGDTWEPAVGNELSLRQQEPMHSNFHGESSRGLRMRPSCTNKSPEWLYTSSICQERTKLTHAADCCNGLVAGGFFIMGKLMASEALESLNHHSGADFSDRKQTRGGF